MTTATDARITVHRAVRERIGHLVFVGEAVWNDDDRCWRVGIFASSSREDAAPESTIALGVAVVSPDGELRSMPSRAEVIWTYSLEGVVKTPKKATQIRDTAPSVKIGRDPTPAALSVFPTWMLSSQSLVYGAGGNIRPAAICAYNSDCTLLNPDPPGALAVYGQIKAILTEASASIIVRSEHQFTGRDDYRLSERRHYRRVASTSASFASSDREAQPLEAPSQQGEYIGFIDIRPEHHKSPIAMALLAPPSQIRLDRSKTVMVGDYGPIFGAHSFPCTVFCMQDPAEGGTVCAHACIMMALGMMLDRDATLDGPFALHYLARAFRSYSSRRNRTVPESIWNAPDVEAALARDNIDFGFAQATPEVQQAYPGLYPRAASASAPAGGLAAPRVHGPYADAPCLSLARNRFDRAISLGGLEPWREIRPLLRRFGVSEHGTTWPPKANVCHRTLFVKLVEAYVLARFPIILFVNSRTLWRRLKAEGHAVVVVGISCNSDATNASLIIHDPGVAPFQEYSADQCIDAIEKYPCEETREGRATCVLFVGDRTIGRHAIECFNDLVVGSRRHVEAKEIIDTCEGHYHIRLVDKLDIWEVYGPAGKTSKQGDPVRQCLAESRFWCIDAASEGMRHVWIYDAQTNSEASCIGELSIRLKDGHVFWQHDANNEPRIKLQPINNRRPTTQPESLYVSELELETPPLHELGSRRQEQDGWTPRHHISIPSNNRLIIPSVITSSSQLPLNLFLREIEAVHHLRTIDLSVLRDVDIRQLTRRRGFNKAVEAALNNDNNPRDAQSIARAMTNKEVRDHVIDWLEAEIVHSGVGGVHIAGVATYFPGISSMSDIHNEEAKEALEGTILFALDLKNRNNNSYRMKVPIIEIVCGTVVETCGCVECKMNADGESVPGAGFVYTLQTKRDRLVNSLSGAIKQVREIWKQETKTEARFGLALEFEPGAVYVFGDNVERLSALMADVAKQPDIKPYVGLNLDITHMMIACVKAADLKPYLSSIMHAHISDGPPLHTRDQIVGSWHPVQSLNSPYHEYLDLLFERSKEYNNGGSLPFTNAIALELEGCDSPSWMQQSFSAMKQLINSAAERNP